ncbi:MAG: FAD:protein FMN transferase [Solirubrobacterales bacterium]|nr:FAD:protein FMN transferase [Solirubrobacterales bacterium]
MIATHTWSALGTTAVLRTDDAAAARARAAAEREIAAVDAAASRFRADSELSALNRAHGARINVSPLLLQALRVAVDAARVTNGAVDPTLGDSLVELGYDRDQAALQPVPAGTPLLTAEAVNKHEDGSLALRVPAWRGIELWDQPPAVRVPAHVRLDLGATAKALAADRAARSAHRATGASVLVSLGGDIATAGAAPVGGWAVRVTDDHRDLSDAGQVVTIASGGLATSSLLTRRWCHTGRARHHVLDPLTGEPVAPWWRTASVAADSCTGANIAATAALVLGEQAAGWLHEHALAARLVAVDGAVRVLGGWPA